MQLEGISLRTIKKGVFFITQHAIKAAELLLLHDTVAAMNSHGFQKHLEKHVE